MEGHPFALVLSDTYGRSTSIGAFPSAANLWTFWVAWKADALPDQLRDARFRYVGRGVNHAFPTATREACRDWAESVKAR